MGDLRTHATKVAPIGNDVDVAFTKPAPRATTGSGRDPDHPTGIPTVDTGGMGACVAGPDGKECFLSPQQRLALVGEFHAAVGRAQTNFMSAMSSVEIDKKIEKTEDMPWYVTLLLSAAASLFEAGIAGAIRGMNNGVASATLAKAGVTLEGEAGQAAATVSLPEVTSLTRRLLTSVEHEVGKKQPTDLAAKGIAERAKEAIKAPAGRQLSSDSEQTQRKASSLSFLTYMRDEASVRFTALSEAPGVTTDAQLLALTTAFDKDHAPKPSAYEAAIRAALDRYENSTVSKMGRRLAWDEKRDFKQFELETRVAWLVTRGAGKRLIYVDRAFSAAYQLQHQARAEFASNRSSAYDGGTNQLSLQEDATWRNWNGSEEVRHEKPIGPDMMINYVEPEFIEIALQKQEQIWLAPPETFMTDYSTMPPRMVKVAS